MALAVVRCPCGCVFRRDESSEKVCPSCGTLIARGEGLSEGLSSSTLRSLLVLAGAVLAGLVLVLSATLYRKLRPIEPPAARPAAAAPPRPLKDPPPAPPLKAPPAPGPVPEPRPLPEPDELDPPEVARAYRLVARGNLGALAKTLLRLGDAYEAAARLQATLQAEHEELAALLKRHPRSPDLAAVPARIEPNDLVVGFSTVALEPERPELFLREVRAWFRTLRPGAVALVSVRRGSSVLLIPVYAPTLEEDVADIVRLAGVAPGAGGIGDDQVARPLPAALLEELRRRLDDLHPVYRDALPADVAERLQRLLQSARGSREDEEFLRIRVARHLLGAIEEEYAGILRMSAELEAGAAEALFPDVLRFPDGRRLAVRILEEPPGRIRFRLPTGEASLATSTLSKIDRGQEAVREVEALYTRDRDRIPALLALLPAVRDPRFKPLKDMICARVLALDPLHETAAAELGLVRKTPAPVPRAEDVVRLKDGTRRSGTIVEEDARSVTLETPLRGPRGESLGTARSRVEREEILRIDRMSEENREAARARAAALEEGRRRVEGELARLRPAPSEFHGMRGVSLSGTHFELRSAAPDRETRETAHALEAIFAALRREFGARRGSGRRILVYYLPDRASYEAFQKAARGEALPNPAYFSVKDNHVAAYDPAGSDEAKASRAAIRRAEEEIGRHAAALAAEEERLKPPADKAAARRLREQLAGYRRESRKAVEAWRLAAAREHAALAARAAEHRATLIHEAFHAFAVNSLWAELDNARLPRWLHEGFASYFETAVLEGGEFSHGAPHPRHLALLREHHAKGTLPPADVVLRAPPEAFAAGHAAAVDLPYAQAWLVAHWIASRGLDPAALERYAKAAAAGADPAGALEAVTGLSRAELDAATRLHLERLSEGAR